MTSLIRISIAIAFGTLWGLLAIPTYAQYTEVAEFDTLPVTPVTPGEGDDTNAIQNAIDTATHRGGGIVRLKQGEYQINGINLKSNVHILIEKDTVLRPHDDRRKAVNFFQAGVEPGPEINNISVRGADGRFKIVLSKDDTKKTRGFLFGNVNNVLVENFDMTENYTNFSTVACVIQRGGTTREHRAKNLTVRNASLENSHYGYGLIQVNAGTDMLFENLVSKGLGVTVRLEADLEVNNKNNIGIHNIEIKNTTCIDGHANLFLQPHSTSSGVVKADGITAIGCGCAVFIQKNHQRFPGLPDGSFEKGSYVKNIRVQHGTKAPISYGKRGLFYPKNKYNLLEDVEITTTAKYQLGPSIAPVINLLPDQIEIAEDQISVTGSATPVRKEKILTEAFERGQANGKKKNPNKKDRPKTKTSPPKKKKPVNVERKNETANRTQKRKVQQTNRGKS